MRRRQIAALVVAYQVIIAFLLDPRWAWNAARTLGVQPPPLPLPAVRATTILPFKPQPGLAKAAE